MPRRCQAMIHGCLYSTERSQARGRVLPRGAAGAFPKQPPMVPAALHAPGTSAGPGQIRAAPASALPRAPHKGPNPLPGAAASAWLQDGTSRAPGSRLEQLQGAGLGFVLGKTPAPTTRPHTPWSWGPGAWKEPRGPGRLPALTSRPQTLPEPDGTQASGLPGAEQPPRGARVGSRTPGFCPELLALPHQRLSPVGGQHKATVGGSPTPTEGPNPWAQTEGQTLTPPL